MMAALLKPMTEKEKWQNELHSLDIDLSTTKDRLYVDKAKQCQAIQQKFNETQRTVSIV